MQTSKGVMYLWGHMTLFSLTGCISTQENDHVSDISFSNDSFSVVLKLPGRDGSLYGQSRFETSGLPSRYYHNPN